MKERRRSPTLVGQNRTRHAEPGPTAWAKTRPRREPNSPPTKAGFGEAQAMGGLQQDTRQDMSEDTAVTGVTGEASRWTARL